MSVPKPVIGLHSSTASIFRRLTTVTLVLVIMTAMLAWFGLIGWGVLEAFHWGAGQMKALLSA